MLRIDRDARADLNNAARQFLDVTGLTPPDQQLVLL